MIQNVGYIKPAAGDQPALFFVEPPASVDVEPVVLRSEAAKVYAANDAEIQQILGAALGYPRFVDDQANFPGATEDDGVCVGDHVGVTLAMEAAEEIERLRMILAIVAGVSAGLLTEATKKVERLTEERDGWFEIAGQMARTGDFYRELIERCGRAIGTPAYTCDDGTISEDVLALRVPEIIEEMFSPKNACIASDEPRGKAPLGDRILVGLRIIFAGK